MDYYASYKNSKDLRKELVSYALTYGNKKSGTALSNNRKNGLSKRTATVHSVGFYDAPAFVFRIS